MIVYKAKGQERYLVLGAALFEVEEWEYNKEASQFKVAQAGHKKNY